MAEWKQANPENPEPKPEDLAGVFFASYSQENPGTFPIAAEIQTADGKSEKALQPAKEGSDIQSLFFDLWRQDHSNVALQQVPADMVFASGAGLDPDITLENAMYQLDRVAAKWAVTAKMPESEVRKKIVDLLRSRSVAPLGGAAGVPLVNVLEVNLALPKTFFETH
jgi:potassium-transporting ATPase KdpC subunit